MSVLHLSKAVYDAIRAHGEETYPHECCGALLGQSTPDGWRINLSVKAGNTRTDSAHNRYQISPGELVRIEREARKQGLSIGGFYHSHLMRVYPQRCKTGVEENDYLHTHAVASLRGGQRHCRSNGRYCCWRARSVDAGPPRPAQASVHQRR